MWVKNKSFIVSIVCLLSFGLISAVSGHEEDLLKVQRDVQLLELKNKKAQLRVNLRDKGNAMRADETRMRREINKLELILKREELVNKLAFMQPMIPAGKMFVWEVSGVDRNLEATIIRLKDPIEASQELGKEIAALDSFRVKVGDKLPNGWEVAKIELNGVQLDKNGASIRIGMLLSEVNL